MWQRSQESPRTGWWEFTIPWLSPKYKSRVSHSFKDTVGQVRIVIATPPSVWESIFLMLDMSSTLAQQEVLLTTYRKPEELEETAPVHIMLCYTMVISSPIVKKLSSNLHVQGVVSEKLYLRTLMMSQAIILHMNAAASVTTIVYVLVRSVVEKDFLLMSRKGWQLPQSLVPPSNDQYQKKMLTHCREPYAKSSVDWVTGKHLCLTSPVQAVSPHN